MFFFKHEQIHEYINSINSEFSKIIKRTPIALLQRIKLISTHLRKTII